MVAKQLNCPVGYVSMVGEETFHAVGTFPQRPPEMNVAPRVENMCAHTVYADKPLMVFVFAIAHTLVSEDKLSSRLSDNPFESQDKMLELGLEHSVHGVVGLNNLQMETEAADWTHGSKSSDMPTGVNLSLTGRSVCCS